MLSPQQARAHLSRINPARLRWGWPVGLRDGALLALVAAGLSAAEISRLRASAITMERGKLVVQVQRRGVSLPIALPIDLGARLLVWLTERRLWAVDAPVFTGARERPISLDGLYTVLRRYRRKRRARE